MDDEKDDASEADKADNSPVLIVAPEDETPAPETTQAEPPEHTETPEEKLDRDMVKWTRAVALLTGALVFVGVCQIGASVLQWNEMRSGGEQTADLAEATRNLSMASIRQVEQTKSLRTATEQFAHAMYLQATNTGALVTQAKDSSGSARISADAAQGQLREIQAEQRPDMELENVQDTPVFIPFPGQPTYGTPAWTFRLVNKGKNAAVNFQAQGFLRINGGKPIPDNNIVGWALPIRVAGSTPIFGTVHYPTAVTVDDFNRTMTTDLGLILILNYRYLDEKGRHYSESVCFVHFANNSVGTRPVASCQK